MTTTKALPLFIVPFIPLLPFISSLSIASPIMEFPEVDNVDLSFNNSFETSLSFDINFFDEIFETGSSLWVNENGNVTLSGPFNGFAGDLNTQTGHSIIAPFYEGVWGAEEVQVSLSDDFFSVLWEEVGTLDGTSKKNTFQLVLENKYDPEEEESFLGDFDVIFNYEKIEWDQDLMFGEGARVGLSNKKEEEYFWQLPGSANPGTFLDNGSFPLTKVEMNEEKVPGRIIIPFRGGQPIIPPLAPVPEPSMIFLILLGIFNLFLIFKLQTVFKFS